MKSELTLFDWSDVHVLIADDDKYNHLLLEKVLMQIGATVFHAYDGAEALMKLEGNKVDVAIIDILMPKMNGIEVLHKTRYQFPDTIFVAYTADIIRHNHDTCIELGFSQCYAKPMLPVKLISGINRLLIPAKNNYK